MVLKTARDVEVEGQCGRPDAIITKYGSDALRRYVISWRSGKRGEWNDSGPEAASEFWQGVASCDSAYAGVAAGVQPLSPDA